MRIIRCTDIQKYDGEGLGCADSDPDETLESFDRSVRQHGLEVIRLDNGSTDRWYIVRPIENAV